MPTVDTTRYTYLLTAFMRAERHTLITGDVGVGKTSVVFNALYSLDESFVFSNLNFSAQTSSVRVSEGIESRSSSTLPCMHVLTTAPRPI